MKKYVWILLALIIIGGVVKVSWNTGWNMGLQYAGICPELGRALTDEEKIRAVIKILNVAVTNVEMHFLGGKEISRDDIHYYRYKNIPYATVDEFLKDNPNCCSVKIQETYDGNTDSDSRTGFDKTMGAYAGHVTVNYKINYIDEDGKKKQKPDTKVYTIQTCGVVN